MFAGIRGLLNRRRFRVVARVLPAQLFKYFGGGGVYTSGQVQRVVNDLKLNGIAAQMSFAVACSAAEFLKAQPSLTPNDYARLRAEFMRLFGLERSDFNVRHIRRLYRVPGGTWNAGGPSEHIGAGSDSGAGDYGGFHH
jgi:hypothetical protein